MRLLRIHPIRAADALQLAAVLVAAQEKVDRLPIMCLDDGLTEAAKLEGFDVNPWLKLLSTVCIPFLFQHSDT